MKLAPEGCRGAGCRENLEKTPFPRHVWTASASLLLPVDGAHLPAAGEDCAADPSLFTQGKEVGMWGGRHRPTTDAGVLTLVI